MSIEEMHILSLDRTIITINKTASNPKTPIIIAGTIITKGIIRITIKWRKK